MRISDWSSDVCSSDLKVQGTIVDYLMPPLSTGELLTALTAAAVTRAILVGVAVWLAMLLWPDVHVGVRHFWALIWFGLMGAVLLTLLGLLTSVWAIGSAPV